MIRIHPTPIKTQCEYFRVNAEYIPTILMCDPSNYPLKRTTFSEGTNFGFLALVKSVWERPNWFYRYGVVWKRLRCVDDWLGVKGGWGRMEEGALEYM
jgi:hypothetical protein